MAVEVGVPVGVGVLVPSGVVVGVGVAVAVGVGVGVAVGVVRRTAYHKVVSVPVSTTKRISPGAGT